jgi:hypothetical protein
MYLFDPLAEQVASFIADPDVSITLNNPQGSYGARYFFGTHLFEEYGGFATTRDLVADPLNGIPGVDRVLGDHGFPGGFRQLFDTWVVANWLDDPRVAAGEYGYDDFDYPAFQAFRTHATFPVIGATGSVSRWAADYARFTGFAPFGLAVSFQASPGNAFSVRLVGRDSTGVTLPSILPIALDASGAGQASLPAGSGHDTAVIVVAAVEPTADPASYSYGAETVAPIELFVTKGGRGLNRTVILDWDTPASPPFYVKRSTDPATVSESPEMTWPVVTYTRTDANVLGPLHFYVVEQP